MYFKLFERVKNFFLCKYNNRLHRNFFISILEKIFAKLDCKDENVKINFLSLCKIKSTVLSQMLHIPSKKIILLFFLISF